ncbi:MAG: VOC family protein [Kamptonema sp. SIO4C4]|nr:VOC family protein [Kamptonema sp. SIO4C4]
MAFELDHILLCTDIGAKAADSLTAFGLQEGTANTHPGQGTANRRFFFHNAMLEFLWVHNPAEARSETVARTHLWERWEQRNHGVCPIGIGLRPIGSAATITFSHWQYQPPYLPNSTSIAVATNSHWLTEPLLFQIPFGQRPDAEPTQPLHHRLGLREITRVTLVSPTTHPPSSEFQTLIESQTVILRRGRDYCLELGFDQEQQGQQADFRPDLPLLLRW